MIIGYLPSWQFWFFYKIEEIIHVERNMWKDWWTISFNEADSLGNEFGIEEKQSELYGHQINWNKIPSEAVKKY